MLANASALDWLVARNDLTLPSAPLAAVCNAPMMPPELCEAWIADCASASQLLDVLDAMLRLGIAVMPHPGLSLAPAHLLKWDR